MTKVCHSVKGGKFFINHDYFDVVASTKDAVWGLNVNQSEVVKFEFIDGIPITSLAPKKKNGKRKVKSRSWDDGME